nr:hypothetical protein BaRGS_013062 [Batillaria attramentaria]
MTLDAEDYAAIACGAFLVVCFAVVMLIRLCRPELLDRNLREEKKEAEETPEQLSVLASSATLKTTTTTTTTTSTTTNNNHSMELQFPKSPRHDVSAKPMLVHLGRQRLPDDYNNSDSEWFFNMKVQPETPRQLDPMIRPSRQHKALSRTPRDVGNAGKPLFTRHRKLASIKKGDVTTPSPADLRKEIDYQTSRSIGDSLIFHNIPERCEDTPEEEVVTFCRDYLVGRRGINHLRFGEVHRMEQRFDKEGPITARFSLVLPPKPDQSGSERLQPLPWIPAIPKRKLPVLNKTKAAGKRKTRYKLAN